jgi:hypothetical protein
VHLQHGLHRIAEPGQGLAPVGVLGIAAAVAGVDLPLGAQEEGHEGQVVVELEEVQVEAVDARQADADELLSDTPEAFQTDNLPVKVVAGRSGDATQEDHNWSAGPACLVQALLQAAEPAVAGGILLLPAPRAALGQKGLAGQEGEPEG